MNANDNTGKQNKKWKSRRKQRKVSGVREVREKLTFHTYRTECIHHFLQSKELVYLNNTEI